MEEVKYAINRVTHDCSCSVLKTKKQSRFLWIFPCWPIYAHDKTKCPQALVEKGLDHTEGTDMEGTLADPVKIRQWQVREKTKKVTV